MNLIHVNIPSRTILKDSVIIQDGIYCFHSKIINESLGIHGQCIGLLIDLDLHNNYQRILSDFVTTLNIFRQEHVAIQWLSQLNYKDFFISSDQEISKYIDSHKNISERKMYLEDLNSLQVQIVGNNSIHYSFIDVFNKLVQLDKNEFIHNSLKYLAITNPIIMTSNRVYDNAFFENALLFQLFEAIMVNHEKKYTDETKICNECKKQTRIGLKSRIDRFLKDMEITDANIIKAVKVIAETRHKFFHSLTGLSQKDHSDAAFSKVADNYLSFEDELKHADGTFLGKGVLKQIVTIYLVERLLSNNA
jgi:hypothetical protein